MKELFLEIKRILSEIEVEDGKGGFKRVFPTIQLNTGQFDRIINQLENTNSLVIFPAIFIHFVNVSYLVSQNRIGEGRGTMRIQFILNNINSDDPDKETEIFDYFGMINTAIQDAKDSSLVLQERCSLQYFDMPQTSNQCQACWIDYDVHFTDSRAYQYRNYIERKITTPMFTNRSDVEGETRPDIEFDVNNQSQIADSL